MTYQEMNIESTPQFFTSRPFGLKSWGYCKIIIDIMLLVLMADPIIMDTFYHFNIYQLMGTFILAIPTALVITDIVFQAKLIHGLRKKKVEHLTVYCKHTKILCVLMLMYVVLYTFLYVTENIRTVLGRQRRDETLVANMWTMLIGTVFQTLVMWFVIKEIKKLKGEIDEVTTSDSSSCSGTIRLFNIEFNIKIESSNTEKEKENDTAKNNNTNIEESSDKAKLNA